MSFEGDDIMAIIPIGQEPERIKKRMENPFTNQKKYGIFI
jgi:hypothetical protein